MIDTVIFVERESSNLFGYTALSYYVIKLCFKIIIILYHMSVAMIAQNKSFP